MIDCEMSIPSSFDYDFYIKDKSFFNSEEDAYNHFIKIGKPEGLKGSPCCDQGYFVNLIKNLHPESILEIGPGCSPKMKGNNVFYFDIKSKEELHDRYKNESENNSIPEIHYSDENGDLRSINDKFDIVFSSHMIEHSFDLIEHINSIAALLNENGLYCLFAPNKNYTFDYYKPISILEDVLAQHIESKNKPPLSLRNVLLEINRRTHNSAQRHWLDDHGKILLNKQKILKSIDNYDIIANNHVARSGFHNWIFTDDSFSELINSLYQLNMISLRIYQCYNTPFGSSSFSSIMGR